MGSSYFMWQNANREKIQKMAGSKDFKIVAAKTSELWKVASSAEKAPFEKESRRQKVAYEAFIATEEGQKAFQEKKAEKKEEKGIAKEKRECKAAAKAVE